MITCKSIGFNGVAGAMDVLVPARSPLPQYFERRFCTWFDNQETFDVHIYEGDNHLYQDNLPLRLITIEGVPKNPKESEICLMTGIIEKDGEMMVTLTIESILKSKTERLHVSIFATCSPHPPNSVITTEIPPQHAIKDAVPVATSYNNTETSTQRTYTCCNHLEFKFPCIGK